MWEVCGCMSKGLSAFYEKIEKRVLRELLGKLPQNPFDVIITERDFVFFCMKRNLTGNVLSE